MNIGKTKVMFGIPEHIQLRGKLSGLVRKKLVITLCCAQVSINWFISVIAL